MGKGAEYERHLCKELSLWWTEGDRNDIFWRTSQSGGRATTRAKTGQRTFGQYGDIQAVDPLGLPLLQLVTVETKRGYSKESFSNVLDKLDRGVSQWEGFLKQAQEEASEAGTPFWLLIHRRDHRRAMVFMPSDLFQLLRGDAPKLHKVRPMGFLYLKDVHVVYLRLEDFCSLVTPQNIRRVVSIMRCQAALTTTIRVRRVTTEFAIHVRLCG